MDKFRLEIYRRLTELISMGAQRFAQYIALGCAKCVVNQGGAIGGGQDLYVLSTGFL